MELEGTASVHSGLQSHLEATIGIMLRTRDIDLRSAGYLNFGWSNGFSYALSSPEYEYGRDGARGNDTVQLQYYMGFELEYAPPTWGDRVSLFARLHHRSGVYGLISPSKTGSNIIGAGIRVHLGSGW